MTLIILVFLFSFETSDYIRIFFGFGFAVDPKRNVALYFALIFQLGGHFHDLLINHPF